MSSADLHRLQQIFRDVFDRPELVLTPDSSAATIEGWDSFIQITLIIAIEDEFGIHFGLSDLENLQNVGQMMALLDKKSAVP